jgi:hypothetical protein
LTATASAGAGGNAGDAGDAGNGGTGGTGGAVEVLNLGVLNSIIAGQTAILAQSLGGIGGAGGTGGDGGTGGQGGPADVTSDKNSMASGSQGGNFILPDVEASYDGLVGGRAGGGNGGNGANGGDGGAGGNGGAVLVKNEQGLSVAGTPYGSGIQAESLGAIGGGAGGAGGAGAGGAGSRAGNYFDPLGGILGDACFLATGSVCGTLLAWPEGSSGSSGTLLGAVGNASLVGGFGSTVTVENSGQIATFGDHGDGIIGVSMGGVHGLQGYVAQELFWAGLPTGAQSGGSSDVTLSNAGKVQTAGANAAAMTALSYGSGYASGVVTVSNDGGTIDTSGRFSHGIIAESLVFESAGLTATAAAGAVEVSNVAGRIATEGAGAIGILAHSWSEIGAAAAVTVSNVGGKILSFGKNSGVSVDARSVALNGAAGDVHLDNSGGRIYNSAAEGAVVLQSWSATAKAGDISAINHSAIISDEDGSTAITLDSTGVSNGNIRLENGGLIRGGKTGTAIAVIGGAENLILNDGALDQHDSAVIRTSGLVTDTVITATSGNDAIENLNGGVIIGSVKLGTGLNSFLNGGSAYFLAGNEIDLGAGNTLTNHGYLSLGGLGAIMNDGGSDAVLNARTTYGPTVLTGNFDQGALGQMLTDLNFATGIGRMDYADLLHVTGDAVLDGYVTLELSTGAGKPGSFSIPLLTATAITDTGIEIYPTFASGGGSTTVVFSPSLRTTEDTLFLEYNIDYAPEWLTPNQLAYAKMVNAIQTHGVPAYEPVALALMSITDPTDYRRALDSLTGEGTAAAQHVGLESRNAFMSGALQQVGAQLKCGKSSGATAGLCDQETQWWSEAKGQSGDISGNYPDRTTHTYNASSSTFGGSSLTVGATTLLDGDRTLGWSLGRAEGRYTVLDRWTQGETSQIDVAFSFGKSYDNGLYIKGLASVGTNDTDQMRYAMGHLVNGEFSTTSTGAKLELGYLPEHGLAPFVSFQFDRQHRAAFNEDDMTWGNSYVAQTTFSRELTLGVEFDEAVSRAHDNALRVFGRIAGSTELALERTVTGSSLAAPGFDYTVSGLPQSNARLNASLGVNYAMSDTTTLRFEAQGYVSETTSFGALSLSLDARF